MHDIPLTIEKLPDCGYFLVRCGDRFAQLGPDEALWVVSCWLHNTKLRYMDTYEEYARHIWMRDVPIAGLLTHQETPA